MTRFLLVSSLVVAAAASAAELTPVTVQLKWRHQFQFAGYYVAEARGYYRDAGLEVRFVEASPGLQPVEEVLAGRAQFGVGTTDLLLYRHRQQPVVAIAAVFQHSASALMTLGDTRQLSALRGRKVMIEPDSAELHAFLSREGLGHGAIEEIEHSFDPRDLLDGEVGAMSVYVTDEPWSLANAGLSYSLYSPRSAGIDFYGDTLFTTEGFIAAHPELVAAFRAATLRGWREAMADREAAVDLVLARSARKTRAQLRYEADVMDPLLQFDLVEPGYMSAERWRQIADVYAEAGLLPRDVSLSGFIYAPPAPTPRWVPITVASLSLVALLFAVASAIIARSNRRTRESESRFRALFENSPDPCFLLRDGRVIDCNLAAADALGFAKPEQMNGLAPADFSPPLQPGGAASGALMSDFVARALREGVHRFEWDHLHADGHVVPMRVTLARIRLDGVDVLYASGQDISATRALEQSLRRASDEARDASRLKSQFLANMSHEVRTPLAAIVGVAELGRDAQTVDEARAHFATINAAGKTLAALANDLLDVSRLEAGRLRIERGVISLRPLVEHVVALLRAPAEQKGLALDVTLAGDVPAELQGDPVRVTQVLTNLLSNAVKFTEAGRVSIVGEVEGGQVRLRVIDTGVGLSEAQQARLFQPFTQVDESATRRHGGAGLGLALSRQLARLMGGDLTLESTPGRGSTFTFSFPAVAALSPPPAQATVAPPPEFARLRVLVVEDNKVNQLLATSLLKKAGAASEVAENGRLALERLERGPHDFDVVLMDIQMPEMDGLEATRALRRREAFEKTPIIALTAHALEEERQRCLLAGMNEYLSKPIDVVAFYETLRRFVPSP